MQSIAFTLLVVATELFQTQVFCRRTNVQDSDEKGFVEKDLWKIFNAISRAEENLRSNRRRSGKNGDQIKYFYKALSNTVDVAKFEKWLRQKAAGSVEEGSSIDPKDEMAGLVENELLNALSKKTSALLDRPYVQKKGRNDFLVIRSEQKDPFVTVVPNDIYYNVEKKCINWLDDCNQKGIRDRLLQKVKGPYK